MVVFLLIIIVGILIFAFPDAAKALFMTVVGLTVLAGAVLTALTFAGLIGRGFYLGWTDWDPIKLTMSLIGLVCIVLLIFDVPGWLDRKIERHRQEKARQEEISKQAEHVPKKLTLREKEDINTKRRIDKTFGEASSGI